MFFLDIASFNCCANIVPPSSAQNFFSCIDASTFFKSPDVTSVASEPLSLSSDRVLYIASAVAIVFSLPSVFAFCISLSNTHVIALPGDVCCTTQL